MRRHPQCGGKAQPCGDRRGDKAHRGRGPHAAGQADHRRGGPVDLRRKPWREYRPDDGAPPALVFWSPGDNARLPGKMQLHYRLAFDGEGMPLFQVFSTCKHFIRTIPALVYDERHVEDVNTEQEDHIYDMTRYVLMEHPISPRPTQPPPRIDPDNPLAETPRRDKYAFFRM